MVLGFARGESLSAAPQALGQAAEAGGGAVEPVPSWLARWRPLEAVGDLPRGLPATQHVFPALLTRPAPRVGAFWTAGNPAGLARALEGTYGAFALSYADDSGDYRRPLDPGSLGSGGLEGTGWRPLGDRGGVIGSVQARRISLGDGAFSDVIGPYGGSPFFVADTIGDDLTRTLARIEGAGGWSLGPIDVGLGIGYESQDTRTVETNVPRTNTTATPAATVGLLWRDASGRVALGGHARWQQTAQDLSVFSIGAPSRIYAPDGYTEPVAFNVSSSVFIRRFERTARAGGASVSLRTGTATWVAYGQRESMSEDRFSPRTNDPLVDAWTADGWTIGAASQLPVLGLSLLFDGRYTTLDGEGVRGDIELLSFTTTDQRLALEGELRLASDGAWDAALRIGAAYQSRVATDLIESVRADISAWSPSVATEVARRFGRRVALSVGGAFAAYSPTASTPNSGDIGPAYAAWIAPEIGLMATSATGWALQGTLLIGVGDRGGAWVRAGYGSTTPDGGQPFADSPTGDRTRFGVMAGFSLQPG